ncbi:hypothetical protein DMN91_006690 [Ooceraea biroi]|uniref:Secreted protein n=1 Tax=Ooceraea biroi TaxID=2015173 RepID=A0A3L8DI08_OOCBI|nr:hypothetical protein DMN91_006690 [Ooceraea biroi]
MKKLLFLAICVQIALAVIGRHHRFAHRSRLKTSASSSWLDIVLIDNEIVITKLSTLWSTPSVPVWTMYRPLRNCKLWVMEALKPILHK